MSTVYGIVKQNSGTIHVYSEQNKGTSIKIYWPATGEKETTDHQEIISEEFLRGKETILFVEDDQGVRDLTVAAIQEFGTKVFEAVAGEEALPLIKKKKIKLDLLITDLIMPEMNGKELGEKCLEIFPDIKVIITSGSTDNHIVSCGQLDESVHFLQKPYTINLLMNYIRRILDGDR